MPRRNGGTFLPGGGGGGGHFLLGTIVLPGHSFPLSRGIVVPRKNCTGESHAYEKTVRGDSERGGGGGGEQNFLRHLLYSVKISRCFIRSRKLYQGNVYPPKSRELHRGFAS